MLDQPERRGRGRVAIVGGGISGLGAAWYLSGSHHVTLFEAAPRLGGHARTVLAGRRGDRPVDTGFIVFNRVNYPHLCRLFDALEVPVAESSMSFAASIGDGWLEYGLKDMAAITAQRRNLARPAFWGMIRDVFRFNARARAVVRPGMSLGDLLAALGTGDWFRDYYLTPLSGAIWSTPAEGILDFPAAALVRFFDNHALLSHTGQHRWYTVRGGSREYVGRLAEALRARGAVIRIGTEVEAVRRPALGGAALRAGGAWEAFDTVVLAVHGDDALGMLDDPGEAERRALGAVRYQSNRAVLHADPRVMPKRPACWSSWNYAGSEAGGIALTYWMNSLQPIPADDPLFVTLNPGEGIEAARIYDETWFRHPLYDAGLYEAQAAVRSFNGARATWYCGAWMRDGFHEDGLASAHEVARGITAAPQPA